MSGACEPCLRRSWLLERLAVHIERINASRRGFRAADLLALGDAELLAAVAPQDRAAIEAEATETGAPSVRDRLDAGGCWATCPHRDEYPGGFGDLEDGAPRALIGLGDPGLLPLLAEPAAAVAIVGARKATSYGLDLARELGAALALTELTVVSGMALGIDSEAHRGALESGGTTVAVLAGGADVPYPPSHAVLHRQIGERGLLISEMPPGTQPLKWMFPARNRLIAALAGMTVVVQAGERSGSLITARLAADLGRDVGAVPGEVRVPASRGANALIADGAALVSDAQAVLDRLVHVFASAPREVLGPPLTAALEAALAAVEEGCSTGDAISARAALSGKDAAVALAQLELQGYVQVGRAGGYLRTSLRQPEPH